MFLYPLYNIWGTSILFQIIDFNYETINEEFENDKILVVILKFSILIPLNTMVEFNLNLNLKIFNLSNNKFKPILNFQMKLSFSNIALV